MESISRKELHRRELRDARLTVGKANTKQSQGHGENNEGDYMIYKGQKLSDNLTKSQRDMFKYMIDRGDSVSEIVKIYMLDDKVNQALREPDVEEKIEALKE